MEKRCLARLAHACARCQAAHSPRLFGCVLGLPPWLRVPPGVVGGRGRVLHPGNTAPRHTGSRCKGPAPGMGLQAGGPRVCTGARRGARV